MALPPKPNPGFEALFIPDSAFRVAMIVSQLAYYDITGIRLLGTSGWDSPELLKTDPEHLQGAVFVDGFFPNSFRPEVNAFIESFYTVLRAGTGRDGSPRLRRRGDGGTADCRKPRRHPGDIPAKDSCR